ncbi:hypothetical protein OO009_15660 [Flavobacteriaceae bacterium KMM 6897]|nr:hypothetical protein [Flavobacteriaceae bacterium KMM 6897]
MDLETTLWGYLPILLATIEVILSLWILKETLKPINIILSLLIVILNGLAIYVILQMVQGAWPTYLPYFGIGISTILLLIQYGFFKKK